MKRFIYLGIALILALVVLGACESDSETDEDPTATPDPTQPEASEVLVVTGEFAPFTSETMDGGGVAVELIEAVFDAMDTDVRIEFYPWARCETMVENGEAWAAVPYVPTPEREEKYFISDTLFYGREMWFYFGDEMSAVQYDELADLQPYRIGVALGYWYIDRFEEAELTLDEGPDELANLEKLEAGRIDLYPVNEYVARWIIQSEFPGQEDMFGMLDKPLRVNENILIISRNYPNSQELRQEFNAGLAAIQENGVYQQIFENYGLEPAPPESTGVVS